MRDKINELLDQLPETDLEQVYAVVRHIYSNHQYRSNLTSKGVVITPLYYEADHIKSKWDLYFAHDVTVETMRRIYYDQFRWHIYSYKIKPCLENEEARAAFDAITDKHELYVMYQNRSELFKFSNAQKVTASDFDRQQDIYIFDTAFTWTYVQTHEADCGPYFYRNGM